MEVESDNNKNKDKKTKYNYLKMKITNKSIANRRKEREIFHKQRHRRCNRRQTVYCENIKPIS